MEGGVFHPINHHLSSLVQNTRRRGPSPSINPHLPCVSSETEGAVSFQPTYPSLAFRARRRGVFYPTHHHPPPSFETRDRGGRLLPPTPNPLPRVRARRRGVFYPTHPSSLVQNARRRGPSPSTNPHPPPSCFERDRGGCFLPTHPSPPSRSERDGGASSTQPTTIPLPHSKRETEGGVSFHQPPAPIPLVFRARRRGPFPSNPPTIFSLAFRARRRGLCPSNPPHLPPPLETRDGGTVSIKPPAIPLPCVSSKTEGAVSFQQPTTIPPLLETRDGGGPSWSITLFLLSTRWLALVGLRMMVVKQSLVETRDGGGFQPPHPFSRLKHDRGEPSVLNPSLHPPLHHFPTCRTSKLCPSRHFFNAQCVPPPFHPPIIEKAPRWACF